MDLDFIKINQLQEQQERQSRRTHNLVMENAHLHETVKLLINLLYEKGVLTEQESAALIAGSGTAERLETVQDDTHAEPEHADVSPELQALAEHVDEINPDDRPIGEK